MFQRRGDAPVCAHGRRPVVVTGFQNARRRPLLLGQLLGGSATIIPVRTVRAQRASERASARATTIREDGTRHDTIHEMRRDDTTRTRTRTRTWGLPRENGPRIHGGGSNDQRSRMSNNRSTVSPRRGSEAGRGKPTNESDVCARPVSPTGASTRFTVRSAIADRSSLSTW